MKKLQFVLACFMVVIFLTPIAQGRVVEHWPYDKLWNKSDAVIIATAVSTEATMDKTKNPGWPLEIVGQNTTFAVKGILKGKLTSKRIKVLHYKFGNLIEKQGSPKPNSNEQECQTQIIDGPGFVEFRTKTVFPGLLTINDDGKFAAYVGPGPEYLLFLKKRKDGRFEPISGPIDPDQSVRELKKPSPY